MWTCIGFLTAILATGDMQDYKMLDIGTYSSERACMVAGSQWVNKNGKDKVKADFTCEKQVNNGGISV